MISVVVTNYNGGRFLPEAIQSVLDQTLAPREVVVADDGSTDDSADRIKPFLDHVRWVSVPHRGQAAALNAVLPQCSGDWVAFLESDDVWAREKLQTINEGFAANPGLIAIQHDMAQADEDLNPLPTRISDHSYQWTLEDFLQGRTLLTGLSALAVRREALKKLGPLPEDLTTCVDDYLQPRLLWLGLEQHLSGPLGSRRIHDRNFYAGIRQDPRRLGAYISVRAALDAHLDRFLSERRLNLAPQRRRDRAIEKLQLEMLFHRQRGSFGDAVKTWGRLLSVSGCRPYTLFKGVSLMLALAAPAAYLWFYRCYERHERFSAWRTFWFP